MELKLNERKRKLGLLLILLLMAPSALVAVDDQSVGPLNGLVTYVATKGAKIRILRQLPSSSPPPLPYSTSRTSSSSSSSSSSSVVPIFSSTSPSSSYSTSRPSTPAPVPVQTTAEIRIFLSELRELDVNGNTVKQSNNNNNYNNNNNNNNRVFNAFDKQDFNISHLPFDYVIPNSKIHSDCLTASAILIPPSYGDANIDACITKDNGTATLDDEIMVLIKGQLKVNVEIKQWQWCDGSCAAGSQPTRFLEADFIIEVGAGRSVREATQDQSYGYPKRFSLGIDAWTDFSRKVLVDGSWRNFTEEAFPKLSVRDSRNIVTVRFPRFNSTVSYDISCDPGHQSVDTGGPVGGANCLSKFNILLFISLLALNQ